MQDQARDITHYLEQELSDLLDSPNTLRLLDDYILDGIWYWDIENPEHEYMSPGFWKALGFDPQEKKHLASEWFDLIFPEDGELAQAAALKHFKDPTVPYDQIVRYHTKSGTPVTIRCRGRAILKDGKPVRMLGAHTIVSDQKRTAIELRVDHMMQISNDPIISWTDENGVETWNSGAEQTFGIRAPDALGKDPFECTGAMLPEPWETIRSQITTEKDWVGEIVHKSKGGRNIIALARISALKLDDGRTLFLKMCRDETQRIEIQQQNSMLIKELKHRVRNLFAVVQSITRLSARSASSVGNLVDSLLGRFSALASAHTVGITDEHFGSVPMKTVMTSVLAPYLDMAIELDDSSPDILISASSLTPLSLMINELATNAAKYGGWSVDGGDVRIKWRLEPGDDGDLVKLEWSETIGSIDNQDTEVQKNTKQGFGTLLVQNCAKQLDGSFERIVEGSLVCIVLTFRP